MPKGIQAAVVPQKSVPIAASGPLPGGTIGFVVEGSGLLHLTYSDGSTDSLPIGEGQTMAMSATEIDIVAAGSATGIHALVA